MNTYRVPLFLCALTLAMAPALARAGEIEADPTCCRKPCSSGYIVQPVTSYRVKACYDPCEPVGPIRRFFRRVFRPACPPPVVAYPVPVARPMTYCPPLVSAPTMSPAPAVDLGRPIPVNPPLDVPPPSPPAPITGSSFGSRPPRLTPPTPPAPIRLDRLASRSGEPVIRATAPEPGIAVTLVHATRTGLRRNLTANSDGTLTQSLEAGDWLVYTKGDDGRFVYRGKVKAQEDRAVKLNLVMVR